MPRPQKMNFCRTSAKIINIKPSVVRTLRDLDEIYGDVDNDLSDKCVYEVYSPPVEQSKRNLLVGTCIIHPGKVGDKYFMTKGHRHEVPRGEVYIGVSGEGYLIMQDEASQKCLFEKIEPDTMIYVPPFWAHRHVNTGSGPLVTLFSVSSDAGHDYNYTKQHPFKIAVIEVNGQPEIVREQDS